MYKLLLVDDEIEITEINKRYLEQEGFDVYTADNGKNALSLYKKIHFDLIITDIMMPIMDGYDLINEIQFLNPEQPFLFITARVSEPDKIYSLSLGADDYIVKPFSPKELVLRVKNILKRINKCSYKENILKLGDLTINEITREVIINNCKIEITNKNFDLLFILCTNPKKVFSKTELYEKVWKEDFLADNNTLNVHIHSLRNDILKFSTENTPKIKTVWGLGYKLEV